MTGKHSKGLDKNTRAGKHEWLADTITREAKSKAGIIEKLEALAKELGLSPAIFALAWCLKNPHVSTVILGASKVPQLQENLKAIEAQEKLTPEVMKKIDEIVGKAQLGA